MTGIICPGHLLSARQRDIRHWHVERAYSAGYLDGMKVRNTTDPLVGFSNLTQAIHDGVRIDYSRLDSKLVKIFHGEHGVLLTRFELQEDSSGLLIHPNLEEPDAWREEGEPLAYLLDEAWVGNFGWSLWIEGEIPVKKCTADELEPGVCFFARYNRNGVIAKYSRAQVIKRPSSGKNVVICYNDTLTKVINDFSPCDLEVIEVYGIGTFQAPKKKTRPPRYT